MKKAKSSKKAAAPIAKSERTSKSHASSKVLPPIPPSPERAGSAAAQAQVSSRPASRSSLHTDNTPLPPIQQSEHETESINKQLPPPTPPPLPPSLKKKKAKSSHTVTEKVKKVQKGVTERLKSKKEEAVQESGHELLLSDWLTGEGLAEGKTKLKSSDRSVKSYTLNRTELFDKHDIHDYFPLETMKDSFTVVGGHVSCIELIGVDQVTDMFFICVSYLHKGSMFTRYVREIKLHGCTHLTDLGVHMMVKLFTNLQTLSLSGCEKISNDSIGQIMFKLDSLQILHVGCTRISVIPPLDPEHPPMSVQTPGCPMVSPPRERFTASSSSEIPSKNEYWLDLYKQPKFNTHKVVIIQSDLIEISITDVITKDTAQVKSAVQIAPRWQAKHGYTYNIYECSENLSPVFLRQRVICVVTFSLDSDVNVSSTEVANKIHNVLLKVPAAVFCVVGVTTTGSPTCNPDDLTRLLHRKFYQDTCLQKELSEQMTDVMQEPYIKQRPINFRMQQVFANLWRMSESLDNTLDNRIFTCSINTKDKQSFSAIDSCLQTAADSVHEQNPVYARLPKEVIAAMETVQQIKGPQLNNMTEVAISLRENHEEVFGPALSTYKKLLELMDILGHLVVFTCEGLEYLVTDTVWFGSVLTTLLTPPGSQAGEAHTEVHRETPVWSRNHVVEALGPLVSSGHVDDMLPAIFKGLHLGWFKDDSAILMTHLIDKQPIPVDEYMQGGKDMKTVTVVYQFIQPVPQHAVLECLHRIVHVSKPEVLWNRGAVIQETAATVLVDFADTADVGSSKQSTATLKVALLSIPGFKEDAAVSLVHQVVAKYRIVMEYVFKRHALFYSYGGEKNDRFQYQIDSMLISGHKLEDGICTNCQTDRTSLHRLWAMYKDLWPTLGFNVPLEFRPELAQRQGTWFNTLPPKNKNQEEAIILQAPLSVTNFTHFTVRRHSGKNLSIIVKVKEGSTTTNYMVQKMSDQKGTVFFKDSHMEKHVESRCFELGETIEIRVTPKDKAHSMLEFVIEDEILWTVPIGAGSNYSSAICSATVSTIFINAPFCPPGAATWKVGMRLEAKDIKNPSLICVATVREIKNDEVLIHFDGWTERYDYWAKTTNVDLHPVGYIDHLESIGRKAKLERPKGYQGSFSWEKYLGEVDQPAVPHSLFTPLQTEGCPPYKGSSSSRSSSTFSPFIENECDAVVQPGVLKSRMDKAMKMAPGLIDILPEPKPEVPFLILPDNLNVTMLKYPRLRDLETQRLYALCHTKACLHLVDMPGVTGGKDTQSQTTNFLKIMSVYVCAALAEKSIIPTELKCLVPVTGGLTYEEVLQGLRQVMSLYVYLVLLDDPHLMSVDHFSTSQQTPEPDLKRQSSIKTIETEIKGYAQLCKSVVGDGFRQGTFSEYLCNIGTPSDPQYTCLTHEKTNRENANLTQLNLSELKNYTHLVTMLNLSHNSLTQLPEDLFTELTELRELRLTDNNIEALPSFAGCSRLCHLDVGQNKLHELPLHFETCAPTLTELVVSDNPLHTLPSAIFKCLGLVLLAAGNIGLEALPEDIAVLTSLHSLDLRGHVLTELPEALSKLSELRELNLSGMKWFSDQGNKSVISREVFEDVMNANPVSAALSKKDRDILFNGETHGQLGFLDHKGIVRLNADLYQSFKRLGRDSPGEADEQSREVLQPIFQLKELTHLTLSYLGLNRIPDDIKLLVNLVSLDVSHSPNLENISGEVGTLRHLKAISLVDCSSLKTPPKEIVVRGFSVVYGYLRRLQMGSVTCKRTKLMMVGLGGAGKTSTVKALMNYNYQSYGDEYVTDGIDISTWKVCYDPSTEEDNDVTYSIWDFAGQTVYYNTHQFFLSNRAVYLLMWNVRLGHEHAGLDFWLNSIACHAPKAPILVVGTHVDQVEKYWLPSDDMKKRYPQIAGFYAISSYTGEGVEDLARQLYSVTLQEKYMGERIPAAWLNFEKLIINERSKSQNLLEWSLVEQLAEKSGIVDQVEIHQAVRFLHDLGALQHFDNDFLKSKVVINPQWIVDVMACIVSIHENAIKDGKLKHEDIPLVWDKYDKELQPWLLRLTEEFDLTFSVPQEKANLVPCLLPDKQPEFTWPDVSDIPDQHETKMLYKFDYLPAGLFNRVQVRLYQYSDSSVIWKKGSLLHKNGHIALLTQAPGAQVVVQVQGHSPENFLFLVHEVFETLIAEAFNGVTYDYLIPCLDCIKVGTYDPHMFEASKIRRATELKVPFLQCDKYFHTLSLSELHASMPPDSNSDFDVHLEQSLRDLKDLKLDMETDIFMFYSSLDVPAPGKEDQKVSPQKIYQDLVDEGFKVWYRSDPTSINLKSVSLTMKNSKLILVLISDNFVKDDQCCNVVYYAQQTLGKRCQVVVMGGTQWQKTDIGLQMAAEVYVKMDNISRYKHKIKELIENIRSKTSIKKVKHPECFISYCWSNSKDAIQKGSRSIQGALGWGDPRNFKNFIEKNSVSCWMDIERVGQGGLFEDIAEGLRHAKVMIACVSDEYAKSRNCQMELRFALTTLKLPVVVAVVGTGYQWESTEVGMLTLGSPKLNCQYDSSGLMERLLERTKQLLPEKDTVASSEVHEPKDAQQQAYQELLELAQRKFLRQTAGYANFTDTAAYPRLLLLDFVTEAEVEAAKVSESSAPSDNPSSSPTEQSQDETPGEQGLKRFCARILCEHEQGWHVPGRGMMLPPMTESEFDEYLSQVAPYAARMLAILRHTNLDLLCLNSAGSGWLKDKLEDSCSNEADFKEEYIGLRRFVMELDVDRTAGDLAQCHLPNGKVLWLCPEHRMDDRISVVGGDMATQGLDRESAETLAESHGTGSKLKKSLKTIKARGRLIGAGQAAQIAAGYSLSKTRSEACVVM